MPTIEEDAEYVSVLADNSSSLPAGWAGREDEDWFASDLASWGSVALFVGGGIESDSNREIFNSPRMRSGWR